MNTRHTVARVVAVVFLFLALCFPSWVGAADADEIAELKRAMKALQAENRALARRLATLEAQKSERAKASQSNRAKTAQSKRAKAAQAERAQAERAQPAQPERAQAVQAERTQAMQAERPPPAQPEQAQAAQAELPPVAQPEPAQAAPSERAQKKQEAESQPTSADSIEQLEERIKELETARIAQEDAVRSIIRDSFSKLGSNINESVALGGTLEVLAGRSKDFSGESQSKVALSTAELDFEIQVNPWTLGSLIIQHVDGTDVVFPTTDGFQTGVERITIDTASITIGDPHRFPPFAKLGRVILPFGISTGSPVADVLSIEDPLTIETFEMRRTAIGFGVGFPTPALAPPTPPVIVPPVRPMVVNPFITSLSRRLGYDPPPTRPSRPTPVAAPPVPPPFHAGIYFYDGSAVGRSDRGSRVTEHIDATVGFRTKGNCGRPYYQLRGLNLCPWSLAFDVDYNSSVFNSRFLEAEYRGFLDQIGSVRGMAVSVKSNLGPVSLVGEWNGAMRRATFVDDVGNSVSIRPAAWQVSLGYQFDWNPWVEAIGAQGTYVAIGYSQSSDLAGVMRLIDGTPSRVGFVPRRRLLLTAGEWVLDGVKLALEYSHNWDYSPQEGGTGKSAKGVFFQLTYAW